MGQQGGLSVLSRSPSERSGVNVRFQVPYCGVSCSSEWPQRASRRETCRPAYGVKAYPRCRGRPVVEINVEVSIYALHLGVARQELNRPLIARLLNGWGGCVVPPSSHGPCSTALALLKEKLMSDAQLLPIGLAKQTFQVCTADRGGRSGDAPSLAKVFF